jgi:hypothetical protein
MKSFRKIDIGRQATFKDARGLNSVAFALAYEFWLTSQFRIQYCHGQCRFAASESGSWGSKGQTRLRAAISEVDCASTLARFASLCGRGQG